MAARNQTHPVGSDTTAPLSQASLMRGRAGAVFKVNKDFLVATLFGWLSWWLWHMPSDFYGVKLLSVMFGIVAVGTTIGALTQIGRLYARERVIASYLQQGTQPKTSELATDDALKEAGMRE